MSDYCSLANRLIEKKGYPVWFHFLSLVANARAQPIFFLGAEVDPGLPQLISLAGGSWPNRVLNEQSRKLLLL